MIDREVTIGNLEQNIRWIEEIECHQFPGWANVTMAMRDAAELLKEQEPVKSIMQTETITRYKCGFCGNRLYLKAHKFCHWCGRPVKWDE